MGGTAVLMTGMAHCAKAATGIGRERQNRDHGRGAVGPGHGLGCQELLEVWRRTRRSRRPPAGG